MEGERREEIKIRSKDVGMKEKRSVGGRKGGNKSFGEEDLREGGNEN